MPVWANFFRLWWFYSREQTWALRPRWASGEKGIRLESLSSSFSTLAACVSSVSAGHMTDSPRPFGFQKGLSASPGVKRSLTPLLYVLCPHTVLRGERRGHGNDDVSKNNKKDWFVCCNNSDNGWIETPLCEAYFTPCSTKPLYIVSIEPDFVENYSPCATAGDRYSIAAHRTRTNAFA